NRVEVELERDPIVAVGQLEEHPRLEVVRALRALGGVAAAVAPKITLARVLDVRDDIRTTVEAGQVQEPALVDPSAIRQAHRPAPSVICRSCERRGHGRVAVTKARTAPDEARRDTPPRRAARASGSPFGWERGKVRTEGVEPSWPFDRRLLRPVRIPVPPHPHGKPQARGAERAARRFTQQSAGAATSV